MGRSTWMAQSCRTCLLRKVKCDKTRPACMRCQSSARNCGGYSDLSHTRPMNTAIAGRNGRSLMVYQHQVQLVSIFLRDYLPPEAPDSTKHQSPVHWVELFSSFVQSESPVVRTALAALTLVHMASLQQDDALAHYSRHYYVQAMQQICALTEVDYCSDLVRTAMILALYEVCAQPSGQDHAWSVHVQAACNLASESNTATEMLTAQDLRRLRTIEYLHICTNINLEPYFTLLSHAQPSANRFDILLDILYELGQLHSYSQQELRRNKITWDSATYLIRVSVSLERKLLHWNHEWQSESRYPLFMIVPPTAGPTATPSGKPEEKMSIPKADDVPLLLFYWLGMTMVYATIAKVLRGTQEFQHVPATILERRLAKATGLCHRFVDRISQCQVGCADKGLGTIILAAAVGQAAQKLQSRL
ncbi:transcriptional regulator family: Fungal Specific TF [Aspergillus niger]|nr:transcriptional regulator family: Fungal Specific TF [Aspergillus niger]